MPNLPMLAIIEATFQIVLALGKQARTPSWIFHRIAAPSCCDPFPLVGLRLLFGSPGGTNPRPLCRVGVSPNAEFELWGARPGPTPTWLGAG